jgi:hypothetical protein
MTDDVREPDFDELVGTDLEPEERERLRRVHELLVAAGPPPELPPELLPAKQGGTVVPLRRRGRRRLVPALILAAALAATAFGAGFLVGDRSAESDPERVVVMRGDNASASLAIFEVDEAGNWPMEMTVRGLPELPAGRTYELWLTKDGRLAAPCGTFVVEGPRTVVPLNAPYRLADYDGWVVTRTGSQTPLLTT